MGRAMMALKEEAEQAACPDEMRKLMKEKAEPEVDKELCGEFDV